MYELCVRDHVKTGHVINYISFLWSGGATTTQGWEKVELEVWSSKPRDAEKFISRPEVEFHDDQPGAAVLLVNP